MFDSMAPDRLDMGEIDQLVLAIHAGPAEEPYFTTFLERLRLRANADFVTLVFHRRDMRGIDTSAIIAGTLPGNPSIAALEDMYNECPMPFDLLPANRAYTLEEVRAMGRAHYEGIGQSEIWKKVCARSIGFDMNHGWSVRIHDEQAGSAWLSVGRFSTEPPAEIPRLLERLAPHLGVAMLNLARLEQSRMHAAISGEAVNRLNFGWMTLDFNGRIVELDNKAASLFQGMPTLCGAMAGRPLPLSRQAQTALCEVLLEYAEGSRTSLRTIHLTDEPWLDLLVLPIVYRPYSGQVAPVAVAYIHGGTVPSDERVRQLIDLYGLTPSEARFAVALSLGQSIRDAAGHLGISVETARSYSKKIFLKTDTHSQAELVRLILTSVIALA